MLPEEAGCGQQQPCRGAARCSFMLQQRKGLSNLSQLKHNVTYVSQLPGACGGSRSPAGGCCGVAGWKMREGLEPPQNPQNSRAKASIILRRGVSNESLVLPDASACSAVASAMCASQDAFSRSNTSCTNCGWLVVAARLL